jgi:1,4-dihydroxy-2-naphthoate octaprenyltransferase
MGRATLLAFAVAVAIGLYLVLRGGWPVVAIGVASILAGLLYTGGPAPYGYRGLGDLFVLVFFGPVAVAGTHYVQALSLSWAAVVAGLAPGLLATAILAVNNLRDADSDAASGKRTLAVIFGKHFARAEHTAAILLACLAVPGLMVVAGMAGPAVMVAALALLPAWPVMATVRRATEPAALDAALGATGRVMVVHALLFAAALALS